MKVIPTYTAEICVGLRSHYTSFYHTIQDVRNRVQKFVDEFEDCITVSPTTFHYVNGNEPGAIVRLIQYPRFPMSERQIKTRALYLATLLRKELNQYRVSVIFPDETYMIDDSDDISKYKINGKEIHL